LRTALGAQHISPGCDAVVCYCLQLFIHQHSYSCSRSNFMSEKLKVLEIGTFVWYHVFISYITLTIMYVGFCGNSN